MSGNKILKNIAFGAVAVAVMVGFKFYNKSSAHDDYLKQTLEICGDDNDCQERISQSFEKCYDSSYDLGSKRRAGHLKTQEFVECINRNAGKSLLVVSEEQGN